MSGSLASVLLAAADTSTLPRGRHLFDDLSVPKEVKQWWANGTHATYGCRCVAVHATRAHLTRVPAAPHRFLRDHLRQRGGDKLRPALHAVFHPNAIVTRSVSEAATLRQQMVTKAAADANVLAPIFVLRARGPPCVFETTGALLLMPSTQLKQDPLLGPWCEDAVSQRSVLSCVVCLTVRHVVVQVPLVRQQRREGIGGVPGHCGSQEHAGGAARP